MEVEPGRVAPTREGVSLLRRLTKRYLEKASLDQADPAAQLAGQAADLAHHLVRARCEELIGEWRRLRRSACPHPHSSRAGRAAPRPPPRPPACAPPPWPPGRCVASAGAPAFHFASSSPPPSNLFPTLITSPLSQYGEDSLVGAALRVNESKQTNNRALDAATEIGRLNLLLESWALLLAAVAVIQRRLNAGTLLPGRCRDEECRFMARPLHTHAIHPALFSSLSVSRARAQRRLDRACADAHACPPRAQAHFHASHKRARGQPVPAASTLLAWSATAGYDAALDAAGLALGLLRVLPWPEHERDQAQARV